MVLVFSLSLSSFRTISQKEKTGTVFMSFSSTGLNLIVNSRGSTNLAAGEAKKHAPCSLCMIYFNRSKGSIANRFHSENIQYHDDEFSKK